MSIQNDLIFKGERVERAVKRIHSSHLGMNGCLNRARGCLCWPGKTGDIKNYVSTCEACREYERSQVRETMTTPRR